MPNFLSRLTRYFLRSRKRSASTQNSSASSLSHGGVNSRQDHSPQLGQLEEVIDCVTTDDICNSSNKMQGASHNKGVADVKKRTVVSNEISRPSAVRNRRVLRELRSMIKATESSDSPFKISLVDEENIFEWDVKLVKVDETSDLWRSMQQTGTKSVDFRLTFPELFPFQPPFLRLAGPYLDNGFVMDGGAICMELLTSKGWSSAYAVESLLVQVASGLTQGGAVVSRRQKRRCNRLSHRRAEVEFRRICKIHAKYGWVTDGKDDT